MKGAGAHSYCFINSKRSLGFSGDGRVSENRFIISEYELRVRKSGQGLAVTIPKAVKSPQKEKLVYVGLVRGTRTVIITDNHNYIFKHFHMFDRLAGGLMRVNEDRWGSKLVHLPSRIVRKLGIQKGDKVKLVVGKVLVYMFEGSEQERGEGSE